MTEVLKALHRVAKSDLHVHLQGAMPIGLFAELLEERGQSVVESIPPHERSQFATYPNIRPLLAQGAWSPSQIGALFRFDTFDQFLATWVFVRYFFSTGADLRRLVTGVAESLRAQGIVYAEVIVSTWDFMRAGIPLPEVLASLEAATDVQGVRLRWIVDLVRDAGPEAGLRQLDEILRGAYPDIVGITIGGSEHLFPPGQFAAVYDRARANGLRLTVHAGEAVGPEGVWQAIRYLKPDRIGHGVRSIEDRSLVAYLAEHQIPLEVCPTSNVRTGIYPSFATHPVRKLLEAGVPVSINSDDPTFFGTTLTDEYQRTYELGVTGEGILELIRNGFRHAFLPEADMRKYLDEVDRGWQGQPAPQPGTIQ